MTRLDVSGLKRPAPVLAVRRALLNMAPGEVLEVTGDDPSLVDDLPAFCTQAGHTLVMAEAGRQGYRFAIAARPDETPALRQTA